MIQPVIPVPIFVRNGGGDLTGTQLAIVLIVSGVIILGLIRWMIYLWRR